MTTTATTTYKITGSPITVADLREFVRKTEELNGTERVSVTSDNGGYGGNSPYATLTVTLTHAK